MSAKKENVTKVLHDLEFLNKWLCEKQIVQIPNFCLKQKGEKLYTIEANERNFIRDRYPLRGEILKQNKYLREYEDTYYTNNFSFLMLDHAMVQCFYVFENNKLIRQRMAFFQSPFYKTYDFSQEEYENFDELGIETSEIGPFVSLRFEYNNEIFKELYHPKTHLSLGNYSSCRIAVKSPLTIFNFLAFIIKNFYTNMHAKFYANRGYLKEKDYGITISKLEQRNLHINFSKVL